MTDIEAKALALVNEIELERGATPYSKLNRHGGAEAIYRAIERHEAFKQEVSDAAEEYEEAGFPMAWEGFERFIIPKPKSKPDPLAEVLEEISGEGGFDNFDHYAYNLHAALEARGLEIREKG
jgi:hypothetical protein